MVCLCTRARVCMCACYFVRLRVRINGALQWRWVERAAKNTELSSICQADTSGNCDNRQSIVPIRRNMHDRARACLCEDESAKTKKTEIRVELRQEGGVFYWQIGTSRQLFCDAEFGLYSPQNVNQPPPCSPLKYAEEILKSCSKKGNRTE